jgi:glycine/D-amino acid oxidase-like deaminating enzyme
MTGDGHHILGPAPGVEGFYFASGCKVAGLSISPTVGEALATWIIDGKPPVDLSSMSCVRFEDESWSEGRLQREAAWQYRHFTARFDSRHEANFIEIRVRSCPVLRPRCGMPLFPTHLPS